MEERVTRTVKMSFDGRFLRSELIDGLEIDADDVNENYRVAMELTQGKKFLSLVIAAPYASLTKEARTVANQADRYKNTVAQAIIVKSLANRLMGNFLIKFYKPQCPCVLFQNTDKAITWLNEEWEKVHSVATK